MKKVISILLLIHITVFGENDKYHLFSDKVLTNINMVESNKKLQKKLTTNQKQLFSQLKKLVAKPNYDELLELEKEINRVFVKSKDPIISEGAYYFFVIISDTKIIQYNDFDLLNKIVKKEEELFRITYLTWFYNQGSMIPPPEFARALLLFVNKHISSRFNNSAFGGYELNQVLNILERTSDLSLSSHEKVILRKCLFWGLYNNYEAIKRQDDRLLFDCKKYLALLNKLEIEKSFIEFSRKCFDLLPKNNHK